MNNSYLFCVCLLFCLSVFPGQRGRATKAGAASREAARQRPRGTAARAARRGPEARRGRAGGRQSRLFQLDFPVNVLVNCDEIGWLLTSNGRPVVVVVDDAASAVFRQSGAVVPRGASLAAHSVQQRASQLGLQQRLEPLPPGQFRL